MFWLQENPIWMKEMGNWSDVYSFRKNFLKNPYFKAGSQRYSHVKITGENQVWVAMAFHFRFRLQNFRNNVDGDYFA